MLCQRLLLSIGSRALAANKEQCVSEPMVWLCLGALLVQGALFVTKELLPVHFWVLTLFNWSCLFALPYAINASLL